MLFPGFPRSSRNLLLLIVVGFTLFFLFQINSPIDGDYNFSSWPGLGGLQSFDQNRNATLGFAKIYVLSLPNRSDRREDMDRLKKALGLRWGYVNAMDMENQLVGRIMNSVRAIRAKDNDSFIWPADMPPPNEHISPWSPEFLASSSNIPTSPPPSDDPMLCATNNNSVASDEPNPPEFRILTPARIACWYSHLSIIETVANDKSLKQDDAVIVLEDDVDVERDIHARLSHVRSYLPEEWDMLYLGHCWSDETFYPALNAHDNSTTFNSTVVPYIHPSKGPSCTHGYALTRSGARRLLMHLRYPPFAYSRSIDLAISWLIQSERVKSFSIVPSIVIQRKNGNSDIMPGKGSDWKDDLLDGVFDSLGSEALEST